MSTLQRVADSNHDILFAIFTHENKSQGISTPFLLTQNS